MGESLAFAALREVFGFNPLEKRGHGGKWVGSGGSELDRAAEKLGKAARSGGHADLKNATRSQRKAHDYIHSYVNKRPEAARLIAAELLRGTSVEDVAHKIKKITGHKG